MHSTFHLYKNSVPPVYSTDARYTQLLETDVFIVDEYSMLKADILNCLIYRLLQVHKLLGNTQQLLDKVCSIHRYDSNLVSVIQYTLASIYVYLSLNAIFDMHVRSSSY